MYRVVVWRTGKASFGGNEMKFESIRFWKEDWKDRTLFGKLLLILFAPISIPVGLFVDVMYAAVYKKGAMK